MFRIFFNIAPFGFALAAMLFFVKTAEKKPRRQAVWAAVLLLCAAKFVCFQALGGDSFAPELPEKLIWAWNWAYSGMCILCGMSVVMLPLRPLARKLCASPKGRVVYLVAIPLAAWGAAAAGVWNGIKVPEVVEMELEFENLPPSLDGYRIVHIADIHASAAARMWRTEAIVGRANALEADLVCLTGDFSDGLSADQAVNVRPLGALRARDGVFAVTGNHEYYFDISGWTAFYRSLGIRFLENSCVFPRPGLAVAGVPDPACMQKMWLVPDPDRAFASATNGEFRVLLQHRPFVDYAQACGIAASEKCDLQLSGHTHGGVAPLMASLVKKFNGGMVRGVYKGADGRTVFVSSGAGQWAGFPIRFFDDPEIVLVTLRRAAEK